MLLVTSFWTVPSLNLPNACDAAELVLFDSRLTLRCCTPVAADSFHERLLLSLMVTHKA